MYNAMAKQSFGVPKTNGTSSHFIKEKVYDCIKRSNGNFVIKDDEGSALELEPQYALEEFWIKSAKLKFSKAKKAIKLFYN